MQIYATVWGDPVVSNFSQVVQNAGIILFFLPTQDRYHGHNVFKIICHCDKLLTAYVSM